MILATKMQGGILLDLSNHISADLFRELEGAHWGEIRSIHRNYRCLYIHYVAYLVE